MTKTLLTVMLVCANLFGCAAAQVDQNAAERSVYVAKSGYVASKKIAAAYIRLPRCTTPGALDLCSSPAVVEKIQRVVTLGDSAFDTAEAAVRAPEFGESNISQIITSAKAASKMLADITATLKTQ